MGVVSVYLFMYQTFFFLMYPMQQIHATVFKGHVSCANIVTVTDRRVSTKQEFRKRDSSCSLDTGWKCLSNPEVTEPQLGYCLQCREKKDYLYCTVTELIQHLIIKYVENTCVIKTDWCDRGHFVR